MQKSDKRLVILVTNEELAAIDDFRFETRMRNRSDAVRALLKLALDQIREDPSSKARVTTCDPKSYGHRSDVRH